MIKTGGTRDIFDVSIFQRPKYTLRIFGAGVDLLAAVGGEAALLFCRRRPVFSSFDDPWAPPVPAEERRLVCLIRGSRLEALTAGLSWSLNQ